MKFFESLRRKPVAAAVERKQRPMSLLNFLSPVATWKDWDTEAAIKDGYKSSSVVYACVRRRAEAVSSVPVEVQRLVNGKWAADEQNDLYRLVQRPNSMMTWSRLMEIMQIHLDLAGNALLVKIRSRARNSITELWPLYPQFVTPMQGADGSIAFYRYSAGGTVYDYPAKDVIHFQFVDPGNFLWGMSPLQAAARVVDTDNAAVEWNKSAMDNRAVPDGAFVIKDNISDDQYDAAVEHVRSQFTGGSNARAPLVMSGDTQWISLGMSAREMDFTNSRKMTREEICSAYQVPPPIAGFFDNATLANVETARRIFWRDTIVPMLGMLREVLQNSLAVEFGQQYWIRFDTSDVDALRESVSEKLADAKLMMELGVPLSHINERLELGLDTSKIPTADTGFLPSGLIPASLAGLSLSATDGQKCGHVHEHKSWGLAGEAEGKSEARAVYWKSVERARASHEQIWSNKIRRLMRTEMIAVIDALKQNGLSPSVSDIAVAGIRSGWKDLLTDLYVEVGGDFALSTYRGIKSSIRYEKKQDDDFGDFGDFEDFSDFDDFEDVGDFDQTGFAAEYAREHAAARAALISDSSKQLVAKIIGDGIEAGKSVDQISTDLRQFYSGAADYRAMRIARTEVVAASNAGSLEGARRTGVATAKTWISSRDGRVRDSHRSADGKTVGMDEHFQVGGSRLSHPGDMSGEPGEVIHCRCALAFEV